MGSTTQSKASTYATRNQSDSARGDTPSSVQRFPITITRVMWCDQPSAHTLATTSSRHRSPVGTPPHSAGGSGTASPRASGSGPDRANPSVAACTCRTNEMITCINGDALPAKANVIVSPYVTQRDPWVFPEPKRFLPERWEGLNPTPFEYLPFGGGPRICLGAAFARQTLRLTLPTLLQRARFSLVPGTRMERHVQAIALTSMHGLPMHLTAPHRRPHVPAPMGGDLHEIVDFPAIA